MRYHGALLIEAGQTEADPAIEVVQLAHGIITQVSILFPPGHAGLTYLQVWHRARQILPLSPGEAFRGDDHQIEFNEHLELFGVPYWVTLRGWAPDATKDHTIYVGVTVLAVTLPSLIERAFIALPEGF